MIFQSDIVGIISLTFQVLRFHFLDFQTNNFIQCSLGTNDLNLGSFISQNTQITFRFRWYWWSAWFFFLTSNLHDLIHWNFGNEAISSHSTAFLVILNRHFNKRGLLTNLAFLDNFSGTLRQLWIFTFDGLEANFFSYHIQAWLLNYKGLNAFSWRYLLNWFTDFHDLIHWSFGNEAISSHSAAFLALLNRHFNKRGFLTNLAFLDNFSSALRQLRIFAFDGLEANFFSYHIQAWLFNYRSWNAFIWCHLRDWFTDFHDLIHWNFGNEAISSHSTAFLVILNRHFNKRGLLTNLAFLDNFSGTLRQLWIFAFDGLEANFFSYHIQAWLFNYRCLNAFIWCRLVNWWYWCIWIRCLSYLSMIGRNLIKLRATTFPLQFNI